MLKTTITAIAVAFCAPAATAAVIDFTDNSFTSVSYEVFVQGPIGPITGFTETVSGVGISFQRNVGQFRNVGPWGDGSSPNPPFSADIGGGGGSVSSFSLVTTEDIILTAFMGLGQQGNPDPIFDVTGNGVSSVGNAFSVSGVLGGTTPGTDAFVSGPISLSAGSLYTFNVSNTGPAVQGYLTGLEFTMTAEVPVPAGLHLALGGLALLGAVSRRRRGKTG